MNKKFFLGFGLLITLLSSGCGEGTYQAEKMFWQSNNRLQRLLVKSDKESAIKSKEFNEIIFSFKEITLRYPYWPDTPRAHLVLAELYLMKGDIEAAKKAFEIIYKNYPQNAVFCSEAMKNMAVLYERENKWEKAENIYKEIIEKYPYTTIGLILPLNLAQQYKKRGEEQKAGTAFKDAAEFYKKVITDFPSSSGAIVAVDCAVASILNLEGEEKALDFLESLRNKYPGSELELRSLFNTAGIYQHNLQNKKEAIKYYRQITERHLDAALSKEIEEEIKNISE